MRKPKVSTFTLISPIFLSWKSCLLFTSAALIQVHFRLDFPWKQTIWTLSDLIWVYNNYGLTSRLEKIMTDGLMVHCLKFIIIFCLFVFLLVTEGRKHLPREAMDPRGPIASRWESVLEFLRKHITIWFSRWVGVSTDPSPLWTRT